MNEAAFQKAVVEILTLRLPGCVIAAVPNEVHSRGKAAKIEMAKKKARGLCPGFPDLIVVWRRQTHFIEVKTPKTYPTSKQKDVHYRLNQNGRGVWIVRTHDEVDRMIAKIREWDAADPNTKYRGRDLLRVDYV